MSAFGLSGHAVVHYICPFFVTGSGGKGDPLQYSMTHSLREPKHQPDEREKRRRCSW